MRDFLNKFDVFNRIIRGLVALAFLVGIIAVGFAICFVSYIFYLVPATIVLFAILCYTFGIIREKLDI